MKEKGARSMTIPLDEKTYKALRDYKERSGISLRYILIEAIEEKLDKITKERK